MRSQDIEFEHCCECDAHTGRAGRGEDSLYAGSRGPYCDACYGELPDKLVEECDDKDYRIERLEAKLAAAEADAERLKEASKLLKEISKVMKADDLHRGNPERRNLWERISKFRAAIDAARGDK